MSHSCSPVKYCALCLVVVLALLTGIPGSVGKDKGQPLDEDIASQEGEGDAAVAQGEQSGGLKDHAAGLGSGQSKTSPSPTGQTNFTVDTSRTSTTFDPISPKILRGQDNGIWVSDLALESPQPYVNLTGFKGYSVDYHYKNKLLVYTAIGQIFKHEVVGLGRLVRSGKRPSIVVSAVAGPTRLAVDWLHDRIYWMNDALRVVEAVDLDGANRTTVVDSLPHFEYPNNLAVDPYLGYLFFVSNHSIYRSDLQGENLTQISPSLEGVRGVKCLTLDVPTKRLYFSGKSGNVKTGRPYMASCGYDGDSVHLYKLKRHWNDIFSLAVFKGTLYFAHFQDDQPDIVYSADVTNNPVAEITPSRSFSDNSKGGIWSITVYHPDKQKEEEDGD